MTKLIEMTDIGQHIENMHTGLRTATLLTFATKSMRNSQNLNFSWPFIQNVLMFLLPFYYPFTTFHLFKPLRSSTHRGTVLYGTAFIYYGTQSNNITAKDILWSEENAHFAVCFPHGTLSDSKTHQEIPRAA